MDIWDYDRKTGRLLGRSAADPNPKRAGLANTGVRDDDTAARGARRLCSILQRWTVRGR